MKSWLASKSRTSWLGARSEVNKFLQHLIGTLPLKLTDSMQKRKAKYVYYHKFHRLPSGGRFMNTGICITLIWNVVMNTYAITFKAIKLTLSNQNWERSCGKRGKKNFSSLIYVWHLEWCCRWLLKSKSIEMLKHKIIFNYNFVHSVVAGIVQILRHKTTTWAVGQLENSSITSYQIQNSNESVSRRYLRSHKSWHRFQMTQESFGTVSGLI